MPETHDFKPLRIYFHWMRYPDLRHLDIAMRMPWFTERATAYETELPYRTGRGRTFRFWPSHRAIVFGRWGLAPVDVDEAAALFGANGGREYPVTVADIEQWGSSCES